MHKTTLERILNRTQKSGECWLWIGPKVGMGYGKVGFRGKTQRAHRVVWELLHGEIPNGMLVCHKCDNPSCVRPDHLFLGSSTDNNQDMANKGRSAKGDRSGHRLHPEAFPTGDNHYSHQQPERLARGECHGNAKLTNSQVREIKARYKAGGISLKQLAKDYGVSVCPIHQIVTGRAWTHVEDQK